MKPKLFSFATAAALAVLAGAGQAAPIEVTRADLVAQTSNNTAPSNWRMTGDLSIFGMTVPASTFDGVARIQFDNDGSLSNGSYVCSGTLLAGGRYVLTAAHCADDFNVMKIDFGVQNNVAKATRGAAEAIVFHDWTGDLGMGTDIAMILLDAPVTDIAGFNLSTTWNIGKDYLITGYGSTGQGGLFNSATNWNDWGWGHWGTNTADITNVQWNTLIWGEAPPPYMEYIADFDGLSGAYNGLQVAANLWAPGAWTSGTGTGFTEAQTAGGDSGGADFIWDGNEWLISGVHSWGLNLYSGANGSSWGDLSGSTAVYSHLAWIQAVPEPGSLALVMGSLLAAGAVRRRQQGR